MRKAPRSRIARTAAGAAVGLALAGALAACSSSSSSSSPAASGSSAPSGSASASSLAAALQQPTTLTWWAWAPQDKDLVAAFEKQYPKVKVNLVNAGTGTTEYTKLQNAIKAGSGGPDIAQIEYYALPQFALGGSLADLGSDGLSSDQSQFSTAVWDSVSPNGKLVGLPQDTGPMALFYNKTIFDKYHLTVPTTWAQYAADAKKLHAANPKEYITADTGDPGFVTSMIWSAGGHPYATSGTKNVTIDMADPGTQKFVSLWSPLISGGLLSPIPAWSSQWYTGLSNGTIASLVTGGWMGVDLETGVPTGKGDWRVAPMPQWTAGTAATSENGGSSDAVLAASKNQAAAAAFLQWISTGQGAQISANSGDFPASTTVLNSSSWQNQQQPYFGGQAINQVLSQASSSVLSGWSYLPFQVYANSIFPDTVGQAYTGKSSLTAGLQAWQQQSATYGTQQGFSIITK
ncbi:MAG TPA: extracellular solute-binding protein [Trebonia sp.]|jgi:multiple sugar transport system substrate-binding protein